jgi:nitrous oxidase accessory protein NosD
LAEVGGLDDWRHALSVDCAADSGALAIALATADNGDTLSIQGTCKGTFEIAHDLTLQGSASSTLDGQAADTVLTIDAGKTVFVADLTVTGGLATSFIPGGENGGGIWNNGTLTLRDSTIRGNATSFSGNGAGIYSRGTLTVSDSTVTGNSNSFSGGGAGIFNFAGTLRLNNSTVSGNTTSFGQGGGIYKLLWHVDTQQQHGQRQHRWSRRWRRKPWGRDGRE